MFEGIIGNNAIKEALIKSVKLNKTSHSYLFLGTEGIGKKLISKEFAKMILCLSDEKYCGNCKSCIEYDSNNNPDFFLIEPIEKSIKINQIREMQKTIYEKPIISQKKVYIINNADIMTVEAQNCLLKTLEEPPEFVNIILIGENENNFLSTIKSRCMIMRFQGIADEEIKKYLKEKYEINNISQNMLETFQGSIGKAEKLKDKKEIYEKIEIILNNLENLDIIDTVRNADIIYKSQEDIYEILDYMNVILIKKAQNDYRYTKLIYIVEETKKRLKANGYYNMCIDNMLFSIWEELN